MLQGDQVGIDYIPGNYESVDGTSVESHLEGIDAALAGVALGSPVKVFVWDKYGQLDGPGVHQTFAACVAACVAVRPQESIILLPASNVDHALDETGVFDLGMKTGLVSLSPVAGLVLGDGVQLRNVAYIAFGGAQRSELSVSGASPAAGLAWDTDGAVLFKNVHFAAIVAGPRSILETPDLGLVEAHKVTLDSCSAAEGNWLSAKGNVEITAVGDGTVLPGASVSYTGATPLTHSLSLVVEGTPDGLSPLYASAWSAALTEAALSTSARWEGYTPADDNNWSPPPQQVAGALDQLAGRLVGYKDVGNDGITEARREYLNVIGPALLAADDAGNERTDLEFTGDVGGVKLTNVLDGTDPLDAINVGQLDNVATVRGLGAVLNAFRPAPHGYDTVPDTRAPYALAWLPRRAEWVKVVQSGFYTDPALQLSAGQILAYRFLVREGGVSGSAAEPHTSIGTSVSGGWTVASVNLGGSVNWMWPLLTLVIPAGVAGEQDRLLVTSSMTPGNPSVFKCAYSDDAGDTWTSATFVDSTEAGPKSICYTGENVVAVFADGHKEYSDDAGATWSLAGGAGVNFAHLVESNGSGVCVSFNQLSYTFELSVDHGVTWSASQLLPGGTNGDILQLVYLERTDSFLAMNGRGEVFISGDSGATWQRSSMVYTDPLASTASPFLLSERLLSTCGDLYVAILDGDSVLPYGNQSPYFSTDGIVWTRSPSFRQFVVSEANRSALSSSTRRNPGHTASEGAQLHVATKDGYNSAQSGAPASWTDGYLSEVDTGARLVTAAGGVTVLPGMGNVAIRDVIVLRPGAVVNADGVYGDIAQFKAALAAAITAGRVGSIVFDGSLSGGSISLSGGDIACGHSFDVRATSTSKVLNTDGTRITDWTSVDLGGAYVHNSASQPIFEHDTAQPALATLHVSNLNWTRQNAGVVRLNDDSRVEEVRFHNTNTVEASPLLLCGIAGSSQTSVAVFVSGASCVPDVVVDDDFGADPLHLTVHWSANSPPPVVATPWSGAGSTAVVTDSRSAGQSLTPTGTAVVLYSHQDDDPAQDTSGNDRSLAFSVTPDIVAGHYPGARAFRIGAQLNDAAITYAPTRIAGALTLSGVALRTDESDSHTLVSCGDYNSSDPTVNLQYFIYGSSTGQLVVVHEEGAGLNRFLVSGPGVIPLGRYFHWAVTRLADGVSYSGWIDGRLVLRGVTIAPPDGGGSTDFTIGADQASNFRWRGVISETKLENAALRPDEVRAEAAAALGIVVPDEIVGHHVQVAPATAENFLPDIVIRFEDLPGGDLADREGFTWVVDFATYGDSLYDGDTQAGKAMLTVMRDQSSSVYMSTGPADANVTTKRLEPYGTDWPDSTSLEAPIRAIVTNSELHIQSEWLGGAAVSVRLRPFSRGTNGGVVTWF